MTNGGKISFFVSPFFRFFTSLKNNISKIINDISLFTIYKVSIHIFSPIQSDVCIFQESLEIRLEIFFERALSGGGGDSPEVLRSACNQVISEDILLREIYCLILD